MTTDLRQKATQPRTNPMAEAWVKVLIGQGITSAAQIRSTLFAIAKEVGLTDNDIPSERTIQRRLEDREADEREWTPGDLGEDDAIVLAVLADLVEFTAGNVKSLSLEVAGRIAWMGRVAPELDSWGKYQAARFWCELGPRPELRYWLAFAPWRGDRNRARYHRMQMIGAIPGPPASLRVQIPSSLRDQWLQRRLRSSEDRWSYLDALEYAVTEKAVADLEEDLLRIAVAEREVSGEGYPAPGAGIGMIGKPPPLPRTLAEQDDFIRRFVAARSSWDWGAVHGGESMRPPSQPPPRRSTR